MEDTQERVVEEHLKMLEESSKKALGMINDLTDMHDNYENQFTTLNRILLDNSKEVRKILNRELYG